MEALLARHATLPNNAPAIASRLEELTSIAKPLARQLDGLGGFDAAMIAEGASLANDLRGRVKSGWMGLATYEERAAQERRGRLVALLYKTITLVLTAAKFVFRKHPQVLAEIPSPPVTRRRSKKKAAAGEGKRENAKPVEPVPA